MSEGEEFLKKFVVCLCRLIGEKEKLEAENARLRRALEKYADFEHHFSIVDGKVWEVFDNGDGVDEQEFGTWARDALKGGAE